MVGGRFAFPLTVRRRGAVIGEATAGMNPYAPDLDVPGGQNQNPQMARADVSALPPPARGVGGRGIISYAGDNATQAAAIHPPPSLAAVVNWIVRHRVALYVAVALISLIAFNGQWRV